MDLKRLRYFMVIAEERQISAAARKLNMSQPPLSYQLKVLEEEVGVPLAIRGPKYLELTEAGRLLYERAGRILNMVETTRRTLEDYGSGEAGVLSIGTISSSGGVVPTQGMRAFTSLYPRVRFEIFEGNTFAVMDMLQKGVIDVGIVRTPFNTAAVECRFAAEEPMVAVMTDAYVCGRKPDRVALTELKGMPLIAYRRFEKLFREECIAAGFEPYIACLNDDARTTISWTRAGFGIGIMPRSALLTVETSRFIVKEIESDTLCTRIAVIWPKERELSPLADKFVRLFPGTERVEETV